MATKQTGRAAGTKGKAQEQEQEPEVETGGGNGAGAAAADDDEFDKLTRGAQSASAVPDAPFWARMEGSKFYGRLLGMYRFQGQTKGAKEYIQVLLKTKALVTEGKGRDREVVTVEAGTIISVGYNKALDVLFAKYAPMVEAGAVIDVGAKVTGEKIVTKGTQNDFWPMQTFFKILKAPVAQWSHYQVDPTGKSAPSAGANGAPQSGADDADIPF